MSTTTSHGLAIVDAADEAAVAQALRSLAGPGSYFTGAQRLAIAAHVRLARGDATSAPELAPLLAKTTARLAVEAITTRPEHIEEWQDSYSVFAYLELVAIVAMIATIDSYRVGLGAALDPLPTAIPGEPVPDVAADARIVNAWVPTVGIALAPTALSALPGEKANKDALNKPLYLSDEWVHKYAEEPGRELDRPQMELVASRTSWLNECFF